MVIIREADRTLMDREALSMWITRSPHTIRQYCTPVERGLHGKPLYDAQACRDQLAGVPKRNRTPRAT